MPLNTVSVSFDSNCDNDNGNNDSYLLFDSEHDNDNNETVFISVIK